MVTDSRDTVKGHRPGVEVTEEEALAVVIRLEEEEVLAVVIRPEVEVCSDPMDTANVDSVMEDIKVVSVQADMASRDSKVAIRAAAVLVDMTRALGVMVVMISVMAAMIMDTALLTVTKALTRTVSCNEKNLRNTML